MRQRKPPVPPYQPKKTPTYMYPAATRVDSAGRTLDAAGKLRKQTARQDLKDTGHVDLERSPKFDNMR